MRQLAAIGQVGQWKVALPQRLSRVLRPFITVPYILVQAGTGTLYHLDDIFR